MTLASVSGWPMARRSVSLARHAHCVTKSFAVAVLKAHGTIENVPVLGDVCPEEVACAREALIASSVVA